MNSQRFDVSSNCEKWGIIEDGYAVIYGQAFKEICESGKFSKKSFLSWAAKKGVIQQDSRGNPTKLKKIDGRAARCVFLQLESKGNTDNDGFESIDETQEKLPFS